MRLYGKDIFFELPPASVQLTGILADKIRLVTEGTLKKIDFYALADYFRNTADMFATGEFWGKLMRAACLICGVTGDRELRSIIDRAAEDMMSLQTPDGCISTCPAHTQPRGSNGSDLWERKYALMGLLSYYELTGSARALEAARRLVVYTEGQVGLPPKTPITQTGWAFCGIESSSILEPVMRVYHLDVYRAERLLCTRKYFCGHSGGKIPQGYRLERCGFRKHRQGLRDDVLL